MVYAGINVQGARGLGDLARDLRQTAEGRQTMTELKRGLREVAKPVIPVIRANIMAIPSQGENAQRGVMPLRRRLSRAVTLQVRTSGRKAGVHIFMNPRKMEDGYKSIPAYMEGTPGYARWRRKVYPRPGRSPVWVNQRANSYMTPAIRPMEAELRRRIEAVMNRIASDLENE